MADATPRRADLMKRFTESLAEDFAEHGQEAIQSCSPSRIPKGLKPVDATPEDIIQEYERRIAELQREIEQRAERQKA